MMNASNYDDYPLEKLMRLAQQGDKNAYAKLLRDIIPLLRAYVTRRLGYRADIEDVVQNILLALHRTSRTYDSQRPFKMWMFAIARHCLNDHLHQIYKRGLFSDVGFDDKANEIAAPDVIENSETRDYLNGILNTLPERQRKIVTMMKIEGHSAEDTARALNMSISAVKVAAHRAYKIMALRADQFEEDENRGHG